MRSPRTPNASTRSERAPADARPSRPGTLFWGRSTQGAVRSAFLRITATVLGFVFAGALASTAQSPGVGDVSFANSGAPAAQASFLHGLAQLHNFEYDAAARAFREAQQQYPEFALAYWGEAM